MIIGGLISTCFGILGMFIGFTNSDWLWIVKPSIFPLCLGIGLIGSGLSGK